MTKVVAQVTCWERADERIAYFLTLRRETGSNPYGSQQLQDIIDKWLDYRLEHAATDLVPEGADS